MTDEERIIDITGLNAVNEMWVVVPYDVKKGTDKVSFKVKGLTCTFLINPSRYHENGTESATLEVSTLTEEGQNASFLLDSLLQFHSDCVLAYKWKDNEGNWKEEPIYEE